MNCGECGSTDQVVNTPDGPKCRTCYRGYKAGKSIGREVSLVRCRACEAMVPPSGRCIRCGAEIGEVRL